MTGADERASRRRHGALKARVLAILLHSERPLTAQQIRQRFDPAEPVPAASTMSTVLDRLRRAGDIERLEQTTGDHQFAVTGADSSTTAASMIEDLLRSKDRSGALLNFAGALDPEDLAVLRAAMESVHQRER